MIKLIYKYFIPWKLCLLCILFILTSGCKQDTETRIFKSIDKVIKQYPQLTRNDSLPLSSFKFVKSVRNGEFNFEIELYEQPDSIGSEKILLFINNKTKYFAIPFFPNKYKSFWQFPFDDVSLQNPNSTFETELNNVLNKMAGNDAERKKRAIVAELLNSMLNCKNLEEKDSSQVYKKIFMNTHMPEENGDSVSVRLKKNYEMMKKEWHPHRYETNYNCFLDEKNYRIYQINFKDGKVKIRSYRQDQGFRYVYL